MISGSFAGAMSLGPEQPGHRAGAQQVKEGLGFVLFLRGEYRAWGIRTNSILDIFYVSRSQYHFIYIPQQATGFLGR